MAGLQEVIAFLQFCNPAILQWSYLPRSDTSVRLTKFWPDA